MRNRGRRPAWPRNLLLIYSAQRGFGIHPASFSVYSGVLSSAVKRPSSTEIKKVWPYSSIFTCLHGVVGVEMYLLPTSQVTEPESNHTNKFYHWTQF
jgi:hypothetical protein